ncbi:FtsK/SpoIIIE domain-containing protein [Lachnospira eligens]|uniref:FtsK/SpoIIIE domain-containing protein n=1 Tax=Lachnospira eligens TaxID=39485 RepID=UPI0016517337|nr:FtsK/SpoIIIE domain-containing protein [Lachnospira eligens]
MNCIALFQKLLDSKDQRVVGQIIDKDNSYDGLWFNSTREGINLRPGLEDEEWSNPSSVILGDDAVHALVAGRTGSGKSVFLNSVIFSLLAEYSPWELNLFLVDLKKVEFSRYLSKYKVPHINAVAATSEIRYVLSLLNYISNCMIARQNFFALIGQQKISDVRNKYNIVIPRVLLIVDEFQQLFLEATGKEENAITDLLTSITKLGRATGFHLIFASQEMSGTMSQSVFANFKARFALACDADVSVGY